MMYEYLKNVQEEMLYQEARNKCRTRVHVNMEFGPTAEQIHQNLHQVVTP